MRYAGIDYGTKKIGVAFSDEAGQLAFPHAVFVQSSEAHSTLASLLAEHGVTTVVLGHSTNNQGEENPVMEHAHACKSFLEEKGFTVCLEPEFLTTALAGRTTEDDLRDASAAALILQSFLDKQQ